uniref:Putative LAGLIDADG homing endonuclease n=1 Tax=Symbiochloris irregularis TaxID=706552 RepID=A0A1B0RYB2_9CHLO|nr:putative LAGLIDADG homing endonuclease [Symbiochloris irregularis]
MYKDGRLQVEQSLAHQEYVVWLHNQLLNLTSGPIGQAERTHPKTEKKSYSCRFYTKKIFADLESIFYTQFYTQVGEKRKKVVPKNLEQLLNPIVLAIWFMDDGGKSQSTVKAAYINATSFSPEEQEQIKEAFLHVFQLNIKIHKAGGNNQYNFYIPAPSYSLFYDIVSPIMRNVPSMTYKLSIYP